MKTENRYYVQIALLCGLCIVVSLLFGGTLIFVYTMTIADDLGIQRSVFSVFSMLRGLAAFLFNLKMLQLIQRFGMKKLILAGLASAVVMMFMLTMSHNIVSLYIAGIIGGASAAFNGVVPVSIIVRNWFYKAQGTVLAVVMSASGIAGVILNPVVSYGVGYLGWRATFQILAGITILILFATIKLLKVSPQEVDLEPYGGNGPTEDRIDEGSGQGQVHIWGNALPDKNLRALLLITILFNFSGMCVFNHTSAILTDIGFTTAFATGIAASCNSLANCLGKLGMGWVNDRFGCKTMLLVWYGVMPLAVLFFLVFRTAMAPIGVVGGLLGGYLGGIYSIPLTVTAGVLYPDRSSYTVAVSYCTAVATLCSTVSAILFHGFYDVSGSYVISLGYSLVLALFCLVLVIGLIQRNQQAFAHNLCQKG